MVGLFHTNKKGYGQRDQEMANGKKRGAGLPLPCRRSLQVGSTLVSRRSFHAGILCLRQRHEKVHLIIVVVSVNIFANSFFSAQLIPAFNNIPAIFYLQLHQSSIQLFLLLTAPGAGCVKQRRLDIHSRG